MQELPEGGGRCKRAFGAGLPALNLGKGGERQAALEGGAGISVLSSRDGYLLELTGWTKGSQAS